MSPLRSAQHQLLLVLLVVSPSLACTPGYLSGGAEQKTEAGSARDASIAGNDLRGGDRGWLVQDHGAAEGNIDRGSTRPDSLPSPDGQRPPRRDARPAPDTLAPDTLAPDTLAPDTLAPDTLAPDTLAPDALAPDALAPDALAPDALAPDALAPDALAYDTKPLPDAAP